MLTERLMGASSGGKVVCVPTRAGRCLNFRAGDFKKALRALASEKQMAEYMQLFRALEWILCEDGRMTNIQWIGGKAVRVITVDANKYKVIKELTAGR